MPILTKAFLAQIGIHLDDESIAQLQEQAEEKLYQRVFNEIIELSDSAQREELKKLEGMDDESALAWLRANIEDFDDIIEDEIAILLGEIAESADDIK